MDKKALYEFGGFRLDVRNATLLREGSAINLPPKTFEVLVTLVARAGHLVEKDALLKEVWPDAFVEEANIARHVWNLRQALGDEGLIETIPKRGYRFTAPVQTVAPAAAPPGVVIERRTRVVQEEQVVVEAAVLTSRRPAVLAAAVVAVVIVIAAGVWTRSRGIAAVVERSAILLADIENHTGDPVFDGTLRQALAVQLEQSPFLRIASDATIRETLPLMNRAPGTPVRGAVAREVCQRNALKAMLSGSITSLGSRYVIAVDAIDCDTGDTLARQQVAADGKDAVLSALGDATTPLRRTLGESLTSIESHNVPLVRATTSSLDALKAYSAAAAMRVRGGIANDRNALPLLQRAIELDPDFATAHRTLASVYDNTGNLALSRHHGARAFELRDRVSEHERMAIVASYYNNVTEEAGKALEAYAAWRNVYPHDTTPANNAAVMCHNITGDYACAVSLSREAMQRNPRNAIAIGNHAEALLDDGRVDEARALLEDAIARGVVPPGQRVLYNIAFLRRDAAGMAREIERARGTLTERRLGERVQAGYAFVGQLSKLPPITDRASPTPAAALIFTAGVTAELGRVEAGKALLAQLPRDAWGADPLFAKLGDIAAVERLIEQLHNERPLATALNAVVLPTMRAILALRRGRPAEAIDLLTPALPYDRANGGAEAIFTRGLAYMRLGDAPKAIAEFRKITDRPYRFAVGTRYPTTLVELARAYVENGQLPEAMKAYDEVVLIWKDADPGLPLVAAARAERESVQRLLLRETVNRAQTPD